MGGCCCCFPSKPPRENPMHPAAESLIQRKPNHTLPCHQPPPVITHTQKGMNAVVRLKTGFERFRTNVYMKNPKLFESLKKDQSPKTRDCSIGSAIEFAVVVLKVECIVVIGHSRCGGIRELLSLKNEGPNAYHFIEDWVKIGMEAKKKVQREYRLLPFDDQCTVLEKEAVNVSLRNLKSYPFVKDRLNKGALNLIGARYDFVCGSFETWNA
ncbi:hypothetical protein ZWY2020_003920 [Hordeum vulgare]|nr:hypothetical protein ZWY2020_003920 [Hordeum vulgare]